MDSKNMQISEEEYYAKLLSDPKYSESKFSIYRFKNTLNGKVYIGQTVVPVRKRLIQHMTFSRPWTKCHKTYFHKALNKYGLINSEEDLYKNLEESAIPKDIINMSVENYLERVAGYDGKSGSELLNEFRETFLNIDLMIINDLDVLFMQLW